MKKLFYFSIILILFISSQPESQADDARASLERGLKAYREDADFDKAISELHRAIELGLSDRQDLITAHLHLGFAYIGSGKRVDAVVEFAKAINLDATLTLDPKLYSSKIISAFNETKASLVDSLVVVSDPGGADVFIDSQKMGVTPLKLNEVLATEHTLTVAKEFFQPKTLTIRVGKGEENRIEVQLEKAEVELQIASEPAESAVYVSGKFEGKTPLSIKAMLDQELSVKLAKEEFLERELKMKLTIAGVSIYGVKDIIPVKDGAGKIHVSLSPAPLPGSLRVTSNPSDAMVYLDSVEVGKTPLVMQKVTPGERKLRLTIPDFDDMTKIAVIKSNEETLIEAILGGRFVFDSVPAGAQIFVDGKYTGITPFSTERMAVGSHQIKFTHEKHKDKILTEILVRGQEKEISVRLIPTKGSIAISSAPSGAEVYLDGELKGTTPAFIYGVMVGQHPLKLTKGGFKVYEKEITVRENEVSWCFSVLNPE